LSHQTFVEKNTLCKKILKSWSNPPVDEITPEMIQKYLADRVKKGSANLHNRDRKNLMATWTWGQDILDLDGNPVAKIKPLPYDRGPQYTPPTEDILRASSAAKR
jgi:hypothetical protein